MSRIGRLPIPVPSGVTVTLDGPSITVKGPKGELHRDLHPDMLVAQEDGRIVVTRPDEDKFHRELHGLTRTLVANMVEGVTNGYRKGIEITGVGYRAQKVGTRLQLNLGYSHPIEIDPPTGISFELEEPDAPRRRSASTRSLSARSPPGSAPRASRSRTRARACATPASRSAGRRARPARSAGRSSDKDRQPQRRTREAA
jgi:large subunit ribosomal protein L6